MLILHLVPMVHVGMHRDGRVICEVLHSHGCRRNENCTKKILEGPQAPSSIVVETLKNREA